MILAVNDRSSLTYFKAPTYRESVVDWNLIENGLRTSADPSDMQHIQVHRAPVPTVGTPFAMARAVFEAGT